MKITCFKAYDIRGQIPNQLNEEVVYRIGRAYAQFLQPQKVVVGRDVRPTSDAFAATSSTIQSCAVCPNGPIRGRDV